jgi:hypothetical protein
VASRTAGSTGRTLTSDYSDLVVLLLPLSADRGGNADVGGLIVQTFDAVDGPASERSKRKRCEHNADCEGQITDDVALRYSVHVALRSVRSLRGAST